MRDKPVRRAISRIESWSRNAQRRITLNNAMFITPSTPAETARGGVKTWVNSQRKFPASPGQFQNLISHGKNLSNPPEAMTGVFQSGLSLYSSIWVTYAILPVECAGAFILQRSNMIQFTASGYRLAIPMWRGGRAKSYTS